MAASIPYPLSRLTPYSGSKIKDTDLLPVLTLTAVDAYSTRIATALQVKEYIITSLSSANVTFNSITAPTATFGVVSADSLFIAGSSVNPGGGGGGGGTGLNKFARTINHTGATSSVVYSINHSFQSLDLIVQIYETHNYMQPDQYNVQVFAETVNHIGTTDIHIYNTENSTYRIIIAE